MKFLPIGCRFLLAIALTAFGLDKFLHFMPQPEPPPEGAEFLGALFGAGYIFPTIGVVFLVTALCLVSGRVILGLMLLSPIVVNILLYHVTYDMAGIGPGAVIAALGLVLFWFYRADLAELLGHSQAKS